MSIKQFHIIFITCSTLLTVFFGFWALNMHQASKDGSYFATAMGSFAFAAVLIIYGALFLKKLKDYQ